ncbi:hypothetical protein [Natronorubrum thiooxidans]|uniref:Uncharacterized protein n=1 Tax=Natronorubrum thiooxidans TaxID=308853 RepID=A0A1N7G5Q3_9EURY|nr:hypothetical protein [Natronorubrum thiooxidans]SIS07892.1 hypothetical protein SAMN05421752_1108 [Natronorubrum thiooxidans]
MGEVEETGGDLDFHSQMTLEVLLNTGGSATAGFIKEQVGFDQTQQVHYRCDLDTGGRSALAERGLVEDAGETREHNGHQSTVYQLTDEGEAFALRQNLDLAPELHRGQLEQQIDQLLQNVDLTRQHAEGATTRAITANNRIDDIKETVDGWDGQMDALQSDVDRVDNRLDRLNSLIREDVDREQEIKDLRGDVEDLEEKVESLEESVGDVQAALKGRDEETLSEMVNENRNYIAKIWDRVGVGLIPEHGYGEAKKAVAEAVFNLGDDEDDDSGGLFG